MISAYTEPKLAENLMLMISISSCSEINLFTFLSKPTVVKALKETNVIVILLSFLFLLSLTSTCLSFIAIFVFLVNKKNFLKMITLTITRQLFLRLTIDKPITNILLYTCNNNNHPEET